MVSVDWLQCPLVEIHPQRSGGKPTLRGTRTTVDTIVGNYEAGLTEEEIAEEFQEPIDKIRALISYAKKQALASPVR